MRKLANFIIVFGILIFFLASVGSVRFSFASTGATVTSFTVSDATVSSPGVDYTIKFKFPETTFSPGPGGGTVILTLNRLTMKSIWEGGDQSSNMATATGDFSSFKYGAGGTDIAYGAFQKEITPGDISYLRYSISGITSTITMNTEITLVVTGVTNPSKAGAYAFALEANDNAGAYLTALPYGNPDEMSYVDIGAYCLRVKAQTPDGSAAVALADIFVHSNNWMISSWNKKTYYNGAASWYPDDFWYTGGPGSESCPTGADQKLYIEANPPWGVTSYSKAATKEATLPADKDTHYDTPIKFSSIQITGKVKKPAGLGGQYINGVNVSFRPSDMNPNNYKQTTSQTGGTFGIGGLTAGTYVMEFMLPWGAEYDGMAVPATADITITDAGKVTAAYNSVTCTAADSCDFGDIAYKLATKTISGKVVDENGNPVTNGQINAFKQMGQGSSQKTLAADGTYTLTVGGGTWGIQPQPTWNQNDPPDWTYCGMARFFTFADDETVEEKNAANTGSQTNFVIKKANYTVSGKVLKPDGTVLTQGGVEIRSKEGCGAFASIDGMTGTFSTQVAAGTYSVMVNIWDQNYSAPATQTITVSTNYDIGTLTLSEKKDAITGRVWTDRNGNGSYDSGEGVNNLMVNAFKMAKKFDEFAGGGCASGPCGGMGGGDFANQTTGNEGAYILKVTPGSWMVNVMSDPGMMGGYSETVTNYIYSGSPLQVNVISSSTGATFAGNNFQVSAADSTINGKLVDESSTPIPGVWGYAFADSGLGGGGMMGAGMGAPINNGTFTIKVPAGTYNVGVDFPPETSGYTPTAATAVTVAAGQTTTANITVKPNNSRIKINFLDANGAAVTTLSNANVFADNGGGAHIFKMLYGMDLTSGSTTLSVAAGTWSIGYFIDPTTNNYMSEPMTKDNQITVTAANNAGNPAVLNITLKAADSTVSGTVTDPSGNPLSGVWISTDNRKVSDYSVGGPMFMTGDTTDVSGNYSLSLPAGKYMVQAFLPPSMGYINPNEAEVTISPTSAGTVNFQFGQSDATITGTVTLSGAAHGAFISAYSDKGGYSESDTTSGSYSLNVTKDDIWYVRAMYELSGEFYRSSVYKVTMGGATAATQDLVLTKASFTLPDAVSVTFDYQNAKTVTLSNGFSISIPAGAIPPTSSATGDNITLTITPTGQLSAQNKSTPVGFGYEITAADDSGSLITSNFNDNVTITIPYTDDYLTDLLGSADESMLDNGYWDTTTSSWKGITGATIDTEANTISFTVNHFTTFSVLTNQNANSVSGTTTSSGSSLSSSSTGSVSSAYVPDVRANGGATINKDPVVAIVDPGTVKWDTTLAVVKTPKAGAVRLNGLWQVSDVFDVRFRSSYNSAVIIPDKASILVIRYNPEWLGKNLPEKSLKLVYSTDGKKWKLLKTSIWNKNNRTVAAMTKVGGYYMLVAGYGSYTSESGLPGTTKAQTGNKTVVSGTEKAAPTVVKSRESLSTVAEKEISPVTVPTPTPKRSFFQKIVDFFRR